jgi:ferredoxin-nitrite reductase
MCLLNVIIFLEFSQLQTTTAICPSLFNAATVQDGILSRIRLPAGLITSTQCEVLVRVVNQFGNGKIQITNRANLQIRTSQALPEAALLDFQDYGLASSTQSIDGLRNMMASPSAGIDTQAKINIIPLVKAWELYLLDHPELVILSNKFSICFDGGEAIRVSDRPNDICLVAVEINGEIYFDLHLGLGDRGEAPAPVGVLVSPNQVIEVLASLTEVYRQYTEQKLEQKTHLRSRPPRLRELLHDWGVGKYLELVAEKLSYALIHSPLASLQLREKETRVFVGYEHLGIHAQKQSGLFYIGVVIPLGRLTSQQLVGLANLGKRYGGGALRLTPWQNLLITDIAEVNLDQVTQEIENLGLFIDPHHPYAAIAACSGYKGCKSAFTDTQADAKEIASHLEKYMQLDLPINLHFSGCDKSCAQHHASDIAIVGQTSETYKIYVGNGEINFGRELYSEYTAHELSQLMERLLNIYQYQRQNPEQSFREFVNQCNLQELRELISHA